MQLSDLVGDRLALLVPMIHGTELQTVNLLGVEAGGIWVESQKFTNQLLQGLGAQSFPRTPVFFLPYHQIAVAMSSVDGPALDEKAFGV